MSIFTFLSLIVLIFVLIVSVSATDIDNDTVISASDDNEIVDEETDLNVLSNDNDVQKLNEDSQDEISQNNDDIKLENTNQTTLKASIDFTGTTFSQLQTAIDNASEGDTIILKEDIAQDGSSVMTISKAITIEGNGYTIDASSKSGIFTISANNVVLNNITFINGNRSDCGGGAIFWTGSYGVVNNSVFTNNHAVGSGSDWGSTVGYGGAIYFYGSGTVINCNFISNTAASQDGGAVYLHDENNVTNCNFVNNTAYYYGGAVFTSDNGKITNCNFSGNAVSNDGGAIFVDEYYAVENCNFISNTASENGGAIYLNSVSTVRNCNFISNTANHGGAIYGFNTVENCNFTSNTASADGGAIYFSGYNDTVRNCNFNSNNASVNGGAIYTSGTVINCNFTGNHADNGGAVNFNGSGTASNCNFISNTAPNGGAICGSGTATKCNFTSNVASDHGGAIFFDSGNVTNCNFINNEAMYSGAIHFPGFGVVENCNFISNVAHVWGGAINFEANGNVANCNFVNNRAVSGGAIIFKGGTVTNCNFTSNTATSKGGALYFKTMNGNIINCNFNSNDAWTSGGAIFCDSSAVTADTCIFKTISDSIVNVTILSPTLNADNFTTFYSSGEKLTFDLKTNSGIPITDGNISINIYFKNNNAWIGNYSCLSGEGWIVDLPAGSYYAIFGTEYAGFQSINRTIIITKVNSTINLDDLNVDYGAINITISTTGASGITAKINGNNVTVGDNYTIFISGWDVGNYTLTVTTIPDENHNSVTKSVNLTVNKIDSTLIVNNITFDYGTLTNITVTTEGVSGIIADIDGKNATVNNNTIIIPSLDVGNYTLTVTTIPDENHNSVIKSVNLTVNKIDSTLIVNNITFDYGTVTNITVTTEGVSGIIADIDGKNATVNNNTIIIPSLDAGTYTLIVSAIGDVNHNNVTKNATITVNKLKTQLTASAVTTTYNVNKDLVITLKDANGNLLTGVKVTVNLNGAKTYTTGNDGKVNIPTKALAAKTYTAKITFDGNTNYYGSTKDVKVVVKKAKAKITAKKKTFKKSKKVKKYKITLKDNTKKAMKKVKVTLKVKGKTYKAKTNKKGKATFKIKNLNKKGKYKAVIKYKGNKNYKKVTKKVKLTVKAK